LPGPPGNLSEKGLVTMEQIKRNPLIFGLATAGTLVAGMVLSIAAASGISELLPMHVVARSAVAALPALAGLFASGAAWGWSMDRLGKTGEPRRMAWAGALGFSLPTFVAMLTLFALEGAIEAAFRLAGGQPPPIHRIFTILFVPTAVILAGGGAWALGAALHNRQLSWRMALAAGPAAGLAFLSVNLVMESLGWVVGAPRAAERATMVTVLAVSCLGAALAGGTMVGYRLKKHKTIVKNQERIKVSYEVRIEQDPARLAQDH
ncbi:MAG: hypothetical protein R3335_14520, partial [Anaerolineales bacterium]|nr:hypothetical protein [Anaerolineales bacterium]